MSLPLQTNWDWGSPLEYVYNNTAIVSPYIMEQAKKQLYKIHVLDGHMQPWFHLMGLFDYSRNIMCIAFLMPQI